MKTPHVLQWNCRSLRQSATELNELFRLIGKPAALLLQETRGITPGIAGYNGYFQPFIEHGRRGGTQDQSRVVEAQAAVFVRTDALQAQLDTARYCDTIQEVVATRCMLGKTRLVLISYYMRPQPACSRRGQSSGAGFQWMLDLRRQYPKDRFLVTGDFNAHHPAWGYPTSDSRGLRLQEAAELANLILTNDLDYRTRFGLQPRHRDTTPDFAWADSGVVKEWRCGQEPMGPDHYPIWIAIHTTGYAGRTKDSSH